ncbi:MAG: hypothetical protein QOE35_1792 [Actinomycetota bacterium]|jgi:hypothetical protein
MTAPWRVAHFNRDVPTAFVTSLFTARRDRANFTDVANYAMFVGYPRSGHSLVGSLLDAHPEAVIAHELGALRLFRVGFRRDQIYSLILRRDRSFTAAGRQTRYDYAVPDQWQGRFRRLRVIGDKKGAQSTRILTAHANVLDKVRATVKVPLRVVHVVRNPFDNISTMAERGHTDLEGAARAYFSLADGVEGLRTRLEPSELLDLRHEDLIADPAATLATLAGFMQIEADEAWATACAGILFAAPRRTRERAPWTHDLVESTSAEMADRPLLRDYSFTD